MECKELYSNEEDLRGPQRIKEHYRGLQITREDIRGM